jgi:hypothetical protein
VNEPGDLKRIGPASGVQLQTPKTSHSARSAVVTTKRANGLQQRISVLSTGCALKSQGRDAGHICECGTEYDLCAGCREVRCLNCDPYLSDDCRWAL